ncbi:MAG: alpha/beta fold hydrolase [Gemmatimonadaceae bacterium]
MTKSRRRGPPPPGEMFPAGDPSYRVSFPRLKSGITIRSIEIGDRRAPPVLFIPGWGCSVYVYRKNLPAIASAGFRAIAVDLKGHGLSEKPLGRAEYALATMVAHLAEIIDALQLDRLALVGHSMGATLLYHFASRQRDRAACLALLSPVGLSGVPLMWLYRAMTPSFMAPIIRRLRPRAFVKIALHRVYGRRGGFDERDVDQYWAPLQFPETAVALTDLLHSYDWNAARTRDLPILNVPAIGIWGSRDHLMPTDGMDAYRHLIPGIILHEIEGAGHIIPEETPDEVNASILSLLRSAYGSGSEPAPRQKSTPARLY